MQVGRVFGSGSLSVGLGSLLHVWGTPPGRGLEHGCRNAFKGAVRVCRVQGGHFRALGGPSACSA